MNEGGTPTVALALSAAVALVLARTAARPARLAPIVEAEGPFEDWVAGLADEIRKLT